MEEPVRIDAGGLAPPLAFHESAHRSHLPPNVSIHRPLETGQAERQTLYPHQLSQKSTLSNNPLLPEKRPFDKGFGH